MPNHTEQDSYQDGAYLGGRVYSVQEIVQMSRRLASRIGTVFKPGLVVGVLRDGFLPAVETAESLQIPCGFIRGQELNLHLHPATCNAHDPRRSKNKKSGQTIQ